MPPKRAGEGHPHHPAQFSSNRRSGVVEVLETLEGRLTRDSGSVPDRQGRPASAPPGKQAPHICPATSQGMHASTFPSPSTAARVRRQPERQVSRPDDSRRPAVMVARSNAALRVLGAPSPRPVVREHVVSRFHDRVAPESALGVVPLRRHVRRGGGRELAGRCVVLERAPSPSAAVREPLAVLHHEVDVMKRARHRRRRERLELFGIQWIFAILEPSGNGLPLPGMPAL